jgi:hypothetical protein
MARFACLDVLRNDFPRAGAILFCQRECQNKFGINPIPRPNFYSQALCSVNTAGYFLDTIINTGPSGSKPEVNPPSV